MPSDLWFLEQEEEERKRRAKLLGVGVVAAPAPSTPTSDAQVFRSFEQANPPRPVLRAAVDEHRAFLNRYEDLTTRFTQPSPQEPRRSVEVVGSADFWTNKANTVAPDSWTRFSRISAKTATPVTDFYRLSQIAGKDKTEKRIQDIAGLWDVYMAPFNGRASIWDLVKSPYEVDQIEEMMKSAQDRMVNDSTKKKELSTSWLKSQGYDPANPNTAYYAALQSIIANNQTRKLTDAMGFLDVVRERLTNTGTPEQQARAWWEYENQLGEVDYGIDGMPLGPASEKSAAMQNEVFREMYQKESLESARIYATSRTATGKAIDLAHAGAFAFLSADALAGVGMGSAFPLIRSGLTRMAFAGKVGKAVSVLGGGSVVFSGAAASTGMLAQQVAENRAAEYRGNVTQQVLAASESPLDVGLQNLYKSEPAYKMLNDLSKKIVTLKTDDAVAVQQQLVALGVWKDNKGQPLPVDGKWNYDQQKAVLDASASVVRESMQYQKFLIEEGWADRSAVPDGNLNSPYWQTILAGVRLDEAANEKMVAEHPSLQAFLQEANIPITVKGLDRMWNELLINGYPQFAYALPLKLAEQIGAGWQALGAAVDLAVRMENDSVYQGAEQNLINYVNSKVGENALPFGRGNAGRAVQAVTKGELAGDPEAVRLLAETRRQTSRLISERYGPAYILTMGHLLGRDYNAVETFGKENPDVVFATNLALDLGLALVNPIGRFKRAAFRPTITGTGSQAATAREFLTQGRAQKYVDVMTDSFYTNKLGRVSGDQWGAGMPKFIQEVFGRRLNKSGSLAQDSLVVQGRVDVLETPVMEHVATTAGQATLGDVAAIAAELGGNRRIATKLVLAARKAIAKEKIRQQAEGPLKGVMRAEGYAEATELAAVRRSIANTLSREWKNAPEIIPKAYVRDVVNQEAARRFAQGDSILRFLRDNKVTPKGGVKLAFEAAIRNVGHEPTRRFLSQTVSNLYYRAPLVEKAWDDFGTPDRIFDAARLITGDDLYAYEFRNRWMMARTRRQFEALGDELGVYAKARYELGKRDFSVIADIGGAKSVQRSAETQNMAVHPDPSLPRANTKEGQVALAAHKPVWGQPLGKYPKENVDVYDTLAVVPDSTYQAYKLRLYKGVLWAPLNVSKDASGLAKAITRSRNVGRFATRTMQQISTPLRRWTVAFGAPMLFTKHALTDSSRTFLEDGPLALVQGIGNDKARTLFGKTMIPEARSILRKKYDALLEQASPEIQGLVRFRESQAHMSEVQFNSGLHSLRWKPQTIQSAKLDVASHAIRRVTTGKAFTAWAAGGETGLRAYFKTREGAQFLREGGHLRRSRDEIALQNAHKSPNAPELPMLKGKELYADAIDRYVVDFMQGEWMRLEEQAPNIFGSLKRMAAQGEDINVRKIRDLVRANPNENAVLPMQIDTSGVAPFLKDPAGSIVAKAMVMNKWNRDVVFRKAFNDTFTAMVKDGIGADNAAQIASEVASSQVARIHFDLGNALTVEAKHRWFAWFATKHRLYGTYLAKLALERPMVAGAALGIKDWIESVSERQGADEFDKFKIKIPMPSWVPLVGGQDYFMNVAPMFWLSDYPLEAAAGSIVEQFGFKSFNAISGKVADFTGVGALRTALDPSPRPFGISAGRWDPVLWTIWNHVAEPWLNRDEKGYAVGLGMDFTEEQLHDRLDALPQGERDAINRSMAIMRAKAAYNGETIDASEAYRRAAASAIYSELWQLARPASGMFRDKAFQGVNKDMDEFFRLTDTDPNAAYEFLRTHPWVGIRFNATENQVDKVKIDDGYQKMNEINHTYTELARSLEASGDLYSDAQMKKLLDDYNIAVERLVNPKFEDTYNEVFANEYNATHQSELVAAFGPFMPFVDAYSVLRAGLPPDPARVTQVQETALRERNASLNELGNPSSSQPIFRVLNDAMKERIRTTLGYDPDDLTLGRQESVARFMARGGEPGRIQADRFLGIMKDRNVREQLTAGAVDGKPVKSQPFMMMMSTAELEEAGYNRGPGAKAGWKLWAETRWLLTKSQIERGIAPTSKFGKAEWKQFDDYFAQESQNNRDWGAEYLLSQQPLTERLRFFGVGEGTDPDARGWDQFLDIVQGYNMKLENAVQYTTNRDGKWVPTKGRGVGPRSMSATTIAQDTLVEIADLAKQNEEWWDTFHATYSLAKFGFHWRRGDTLDDMLWTKDDPTFEYKPEYELEDYYDIYESGL